MSVPCVTDDTKGARWIELKLDHDEFSLIPKRYFDKIIRIMEIHVNTLKGITGDPALEELFDGIYAIASASSASSASINVDSNDNELSYLVMLLINYMIFPSVDVFSYTNAIKHAQLGHSSVDNYFGNLWKEIFKESRHKVSDYENILKIDQYHYGSTLKVIEGTRKVYFGLLPYGYDKAKKELTRSLFGTREPDSTLNKWIANYSHTDFTLIRRTDIPIIYCSGPTASRSMFDLRTIILDSWFVKTNNALGYAIAYKANKFNDDVGKTDLKYPDKLKFILADNSVVTFNLIRDYRNYESDNYDLLIYKVSNVKPTDNILMALADSE